MKRAKADSKLDEDPGDEAGWELFLNCLPGPGEVWQRLEELPDWKNRLSYPILLAASVLLADSSTEEIRQPGALLLAELLGGSQPDTILESAIKKLLPGQDGRPVLLLLQRRPDLADSPYVVTRAILTTLTRCGEWLKQASNLKGLPADRREALNCIHKALALVRQYEPAEDLAVHLEGIQQWHDYALNLLDSTI